MPSSNRMSSHSEHSQPFDERMEDQTKRKNNEAIPLPRQVTPTNKNVTVVKQPQQKMKAEQTWKKETEHFDKKWFQANPIDHVCTLITHI